MCRFPDHQSERREWKTVEFTYKKRSAIIRCGVGAANDRSSTGGVCRTVLRFPSHRVTERSGAFDINLRHRRKGYSAPFVSKHPCFYLDQENGLDASTRIKRRHPPADGRIRAPPPNSVSACASPVCLFRCRYQPCRVVASSSAAISLLRVAAHERYCSFLHHFGYWLLCHLSSASTTLLRGDLTTTMDISSKPTYRVGTGRVTGKGTQVRRCGASRSRARCGACADARFTVSPRPPRRLPDAHPPAFCLLA